MRRTRSNASITTQVLGGYTVGTVWVESFANIGADTILEMSNFEGGGKIRSFVSCFKRHPNTLNPDDDLTVYIGDCSFSDVKSLTRTWYNAANAVVNGAMFTSASAFTDDASAITGGLVKGNLYYNTTTNSIKKGIIMENKF